MSTRRLIAYRHAGGYEAIHLSYDGDNAPAVLEADWSTESMVNDLISGGDVLVLDGDQAERSPRGGRRSALACDFNDLVSMLHGNERLISIFDAVGTARRDIGEWNAKCADWQGLEIENDDSCGQWIHLTTREETLHREALAEEMGLRAA